MRNRSIFIAVVLGAVAAGVVYYLMHGFDKTVKQRLMVEDVSISVPDEYEFINHYGHILFSDSVSSSLQFDKPEFRNLVNAIEGSPHFNDSAALVNPVLINGTAGIWFRNFQGYEYVRLSGPKHRILVHSGEQLMTFISN